MDLLLATHYPGSVRVEGEMLPASACRTNLVDWQVAARIVTYRRVEWAIDSFAPYKSPGIDGIFSGHVPTAWRQVKVVFIPKPGRNSYCGPKDFRPISPTSFLLKTLERLVDRFLRDEILRIMGLFSGDPTCRFCRMETETVQHITCCCEALARQRYNILGSYLLNQKI